MVKSPPSLIHDKLSYALHNFIIKTNLLKQLVDNVDNLKNWSNKLNHGLDVTMTSLDVTMKVYNDNWLEMLNYLLI